jgi:beta-glucosidase
MYEIAAMKCFLITICITLTGLISNAQDFKEFPMWNSFLPIEQRVNDLVGRLTREEKIAQMLNSAPAVPRLGIPAYDWWNEVLHGVACTPYKTTFLCSNTGRAAAELLSG